MKEFPHVLSALTITVDGTGEDSDDDNDESCRVAKQLRVIGRRDVCESRVRVDDSMGWKSMCADPRPNRRWSQS